MKVRSDFTVKKKGLNTESAQFFLYVYKKVYCFVVIETDPALSVLMEVTNSLFFFLYLILFSFRNLKAKTQGKISQIEQKHAQRRLGCPH